MALLPGDGCLTDGLKMVLVQATEPGWWCHQWWYLKERNCLRDKFSRFSQMFTKYAKLRPSEKSTDSQFAKLNPQVFQNYQNLYFYIRFSIN